MDDKFWYLKNCDLFEKLTPQQAARLESRARSKHFEKGSLIYLPADPSDSVLLLASGRIKIYHITGEGKQAVLALIDSGELFGELALVDAGQRSEFAEALEDSTVILIPGAEIQQLMEEHAGLALGVTKLIGLRRQRIERRLKSLLFRSNRERVVHLLLELAEKYGRPTADGVQLDVKLSHQDLANIIGSTRETVTVVLGELQAGGVIAVNRRRITLTQVERLADSIDVPPPRIPEPRLLGRPIVRQAQFES